MQLYVFFKSGFQKDFTYKKKFDMVCIVFVALKQKQYYFLKKNYVIIFKVLGCK